MVVVVVVVVIVVVVVVLVVVVSRSRSGSGSGSSNEMVRVCTLATVERSSNSIRHHLLKLTQRLARLHASTAARALKIQTLTACLAEIRTADPASLAWAKW